MPAFHSHFSALSNSMKNSNRTLTHTHTHFTSAKILGIDGDWIHLALKAKFSPTTDNMKLFYMAISYSIQLITLSDAYAASKIVCVCEFRYLAIFASVIIFDASVPCDKC